MSFQSLSRGPGTSSGDATTQAQHPGPRIELSTPTFSSSVDAAAGVTTNSSRTSEQLDQAFREADGLVFQLATSVEKLKKLVDQLGTARDTVEHRHKLSSLNTRIQTLAQQVKECVTNLSLHKSQYTQAQQAKSQKLLQDFTSILQEYKATQKLSVNKQAASLPHNSPSSIPVAAALVADNGQDESSSERQALLQQQRQQETRAMDMAIDYNEALIEERDQGIQEINRQIGEVNEMFQDLAVLINDQGQQLITIDNHISTTAERTQEGKRELVKAERYQRSARNKCLQIALILAVIVSIVIIIIFNLPK